MSYITGWSDRCTPAYPTGPPKSSGGCYMAAAVVPTEVCVRSRAAPGACEPTRFAKPLDWRRFANSIDDVPALMSEASRSTFNGKLAYLVRRSSAGEER